MASVLLLNPPGSRPYVRDCYCSLVGRRGYAFQPLDLLLQSGFLHEAGHRVEALDAIAWGVPRDEVLARVRGTRPEAVLVLGGAASAREDLPFLESLREAAPGALVVGSGDLFQFDPRGALERSPALDGVLTDFAAPDLVRWLSGERDAAPAVVDRGPQVPRGRRAARWRQPRPRHDLFPKGSYRLPYHPRPFASVLTGYGCPYSCTFCNTSQVPFKVREAENVLEELEWLHRGLGYGDVYLRDATLGVSRPQIAAICEGILARGLTLSWNSFTRADLLDPALLRLMARAGCRLLQLGIETADPRLLEAHRKDLTPLRVAETVRACREAGIAVCGHFIVAWPGRPPDEGAREAARWAVELGCTFASFNVAEPRPGTPFRGAFGPGETAEDANARARPARGAAMRRFYLDPRTAFRIGRSLSGPGEWIHALRLAGAALG